jgi:oxygen-independent coproporphyrinogen-3 oxidase
MFKLTHDYLTVNGYDHYEISNYGKPPHSHSRHNQIYWEGDREYLAFGCGAASYLDQIRFSRPKTLSEYYQYIECLKKNGGTLQTEKET